MRRVWNWLTRELRQLFPIWLFFFSMFALLRLIQLVALAQYGISPATESLVLVGSLIISKVLLIADKFRFVERFHGRPLIYATLWKTAIYYLGCLIFQLIDRVPSILRLHEPFREAMDGIFGRMARSQFWVAQLWVLILILGFSATRELYRALGKERFYTLFFGEKGRGTGSTATRRAG